MQSRQIPQKIVSGIITLILGLQLVGCGTILYPDRRHKNIQVDPGGRQIDPAVAVLDAACLVFFVIPGIIAFAVDFGTGAIYLPDGTRASQMPSKDNMVILNKNQLYNDNIARVVQNRTGVDLSFSNPELKAFQLKADDHVALQITG